MCCILTRPRCVFFFLLQKTDATLLRRRRIRRQTERILLLGFVILFDKGDSVFFVLFFFCTNKFHKRLTHLKYIINWHIYISEAIKYTIIYVTIVFTRITLFVWKSFQNLNHR